MRTPLDLPMLLLASMVVVSAFATSDFAISRVKILSLLVGLFAFYVSQAYAQMSKSRIWIVFWLYSGAGSVIGLVGVLSTEWSVKFAPLAPIVTRLPHRVITLPGRDIGVNANELAGILLWLVPLFMSSAVLLCCQLRANGSGTVVSVTLVGSALSSLLAVVSCLLLVVTQSRGALLGFALAVVLMLLAAGRRWSSAAVALSLLVTGAALVGVYTQLSLPPDVSYDSKEVASTLAGRVEIWSRAIFAIQDFPFTGMGMNTFRTLVHKIYPMMLTGPTVDIAHAHNMWLQAALDLGLPGLVAYVSIWLTILAMQIEVVRRTDDPALRAVSLGILGCLVAYLVYGVTDTVALGAIPSLLFWILLGIGTATWKLAVRSVAVDCEETEGAPALASSCRG